MIPAPGSRHPPAQVMRRADDLGAGRAKTLQRVEADGIRGQQIREVDAQLAGGAGAGAPQLMHLRGIQSPGEVNDAFLSLLLNLNAAFHADSSEQGWLQATSARPRHLPPPISPPLVSPAFGNHNIL